MASGLARGAAGRVCAAARVGEGGDEHFRRWRLLLSVSQIGRFAPFAATLGNDRSLRGTAAHDVDRSFQITTADVATGREPAGRCSTRGQRSTPSRPCRTRSTSSQSSATISDRLSPPAKPIKRSARSRTSFSEPPMAARTAKRLSRSREAWPAAGRCPARPGCRAWWRGQAEIGRGSDGRWLLQGPWTGPRHPAPRPGSRHRQRDPHSRGRHIRYRRRARHRLSSGRWSEVARTDRRRPERTRHCDGTRGQVGSRAGGERLANKASSCTLSPPHFCSLTLGTHPRLSLRAVLHQRAALAPHLSSSGAGLFLGANDRAGKERGHTKSGPPRNPWQPAKSLSSAPAYPLNIGGSPTAASQIAVPAH